MMVQISHLVLVAMKEHIRDLAGTRIQEDFLEEVVCELYFEEYV